MATHSAHWQIAGNGVQHVPTEKRDTHTRGIPAPPPAVWPLLGTIAVTWITVLGVILWHAAPAFSGIALAGFLIGCAGVAAVAAASTLVSPVMHPAPARRTETAV